MRRHIKRIVTIALVKTLMYEVGIVAGWAIGHLLIGG